MASIKKKSVVTAPKSKITKSTKSTVKVAKPKTVKKVARSAKTIEPDSIAPSVEKQEIIAQYQVKEGDTGSPEVQVALLTKRIEKLVAHLKSNPGDNHSRRGLLGIVSKRRRLMNYLEKKDPKRYKEVANRLGLK